MRKYETPKAEKIDFNYAENVAASGSGHECSGNPKPWHPWFPWFPGKH